MKKLLNIFLALSLMVAVAPAQAMQDTITTAVKDAGRMTADAARQVGESVRQAGAAARVAYDDMIAFMAPAQVMFAFQHLIGWHEIMWHLRIMGRGLRILALPLTATVATYATSTHFLGREGTAAVAGDAAFALFAGYMIRRYLNGERVNPAIVALGIAYYVAHRSTV